MSALDSQWLLRPVTDPVRWDAFVADSAQGTVFSSWYYLTALSQPFTCLELVDANQRAVAGVAIIEDAGRMHTAPFPFTPHQGLLFAPHLNELPNYKRVINCLKITEAIITELINRYGNVSMALSPALEDIRPFSWYNHGQAALPQFRINVRYTARLDLSDFQLNNYLAGIRSVRRQEFHKSAAVVSVTNNIAGFLELYVRTFERQQLTVTQTSLQIAKRIAESALNHGYGRLTVATVAGKPASYSLFVHDAGTAYYLFGANDPAFRSSGASTKLMIENLAYFAAQGLASVDFVGVNSPQRGEFKMTFNPALAPYFEVHLDAVHTD
jgi:hypothetical protein